MEEKNSLRIRIMAERKQYPPEKQILDAAKVMDRLISMEEIQTQQNVLLYYEKKPELSLHQFAGWCLEKGKYLYYPRVNGDNMEFYRIRSMEELSIGYFGIMEPGENCECFHDREGICLVPGVAFDWKGNRIGYGKGFYDRYFGRHRNCQIKKLGIAYDFQVVDEIEAGIYDQQMDGLITPSKIINF